MQLHMDDRLYAGLSLIKVTYEDKRGQEYTLVIDDARIVYVSDSGTLYQSESGFFRETKYKELIGVKYE